MIYQGLKKLLKQSEIQDTPNNKNRWRPKIRPKMMDGKPVYLAKSKKGDWLKKLMMMA